MTQPPQTTPIAKNHTNFSLKIIHWNVCSIRNKKDYLIFLINEQNPDVVFLNETWLKSEECFHIRGYRIIRDDRGDGHGGIASLIKENVQFQRVVVDDTYLPTVFQYIAVHIDNTTYINLYNPPDNNIYPKSWERFVKSFFGEICILGDINAHHPLWDTTPINRNGRTVHDTLDDLNLVVMNDGTSTRFSHSQALHTSAVDLVLCSSSLAQGMTWTVLGDPGRSDHYPVMCTVHMQVNTAGFRPPALRRQINKANWSLYRESVNSNFNPLNPSYVDFEHAIKYAADIAIPTKACSTKSKKICVPWWDSECTLAMNRRKIALRTFSNNPTLDNYLAAKESIARAHRLFKSKKREKYRVFCGTLNRNSNITQVWRFFRNMSRAYSPQPSPSLPPPRMAVEMLNNISGCYIIPDFQLEPNIPEYEPFSLAEMKYTLSSKKDKATGLDDVSYSMIKNLPDEALMYLLDLYNGCTQGLSLPPSWNTHLLYHILKSGKDATSTDSYRPIALTSCIGKILESLVRNRLEWYIESYLSLPELQSAFRKGRSVVDNVTYLSSFVQLSFSKGQFALAVFLDIKSAFDNVDLYCLYRSLVALNIPTNLCNIIFRLFHERQVYIKDSLGQVHGPGSVTLGVPQGSSLSPLLFNIYMHGLNSVIPPSTKIIHYADDILLLLSGKNIPTLVAQMNATLENVCTWLREHNLSLSTSKSSAMAFRKRATHTPLPDVECNGEVIPWRTSVRYLGVVFQNTLSWTEHVNHVCNTASKGLNLMRASAGRGWGADPAVLRNVYCGLVRSHLDYCCQVLQPLPKYLITKLDRIQFQALRIILGSMKSTPTNALLAECAEPSLDHRRKWLALKFTLKLVRNTNHPLITLLRELAPYCLSRQGYWRSRTTPYLVLAINAVDRFNRRIWNATTLPCFKVRLGYQLSEIRYTQLQLDKQSDNQQAFVDLVNSRWPSHTLIFTDASRDNATNRSGIGVYIPGLNIEYAARLPSNSQIYTAEIIAIQLACSYIIEGQLTQAVICSDSLTALQMIADAKYSASSHYVALKTKKTIIDLRLSGNSIELVWVPSHTNITGNEKADTLAKKGTNFDTYLNYKLDPQNYLPTLKKQLWEQWQLEWQNTTRVKGRWYAGFQPFFPKKPWFSKFPYSGRRHITTIIRMRTGHCLTSEHKFRIGVADNPLCECGQIEDLNHLIFDCPINVTLDFDLYRKLVACQIKAPINISSLLTDLNYEASVVLAKYLKLNNIQL